MKQWGGTKKHLDGRDVGCQTLTLLMTKPAIIRLWQTLTLLMTDSDSLDDRLWLSWWQNGQENVNNQSRQYCQNDQESDQENDQGNPQRRSSIISQNDQEHDEDNPPFGVGRRLFRCLAAMCVVCLFLPSLTRVRCSVVMPIVLLQCLLF